MPRCISCSRGPVWEASHPGGRFTQPRFEHFKQISHRSYHEAIESFLIMATTINGGGFGSPAEHLSLDDVKEFMWVALRSQERFSANLHGLVEGLDKLTTGKDEWLLQVWRTSPLEGTCPAKGQDSPKYSWLT